MGGRGSAFVNYHNANSSSGVDLGILDDIISSVEEDKDTQLSHKGYTEKLKENNIHIKQSTDKISDEILVANAMKINQMTNEYTKTTKMLKKNNEQLRVRAAKMNDKTEAVFVSSQTNFEHLQVVYNKNMQYMNKERLEQQIQNQIDQNFWTKSDKNELVNHTISHEYGHYIQRVLMERDIRQHKEDKERRQKLINDIKAHPKNKDKANQLVKKYSEEYATKYIKSVQRICRKNFGRDYEQKILSQYSTENNREYFAEIFCNSATNKNPDDLGKAMQIYLNKKLN